MRVPIISERLVGLNSGFGSRATSVLPLIVCLTIENVPKMMSARPISPAGSTLKLLSMTRRYKAGGKKKMIPTTIPSNAEPVSTVLCDLYLTSSLIAVVGDRQKLLK